MTTATILPSQTLLANDMGSSTNPQQTPHNALSKLYLTGLVIASALLINALIIWMLCSLNGMKMPAMQQQQQPITVMLNQHNPPRPQEQQQEPQPEVKPQILTVNLQMPDPTPPTPQLQTLDLNLAMPNMSPVMVSVMTPPTPAVVKPVTRVTPKPKPAPTPATPQTMNSDQVDTPPRELASNPTPVYPDREKQRGRTGEVTVKLLINELGRVEDVQLVSNTGSQRFVQSVMQVIRQFRFTPAKHHGQQVKVWGIKTIRFEIGE
tara:strand:+ start:160 stop:951 length:792 start_codon:yes stop_codon:yes gene_type:complete